MNVSIKQSPDRCLLIRKTINDIKSILLRNVFEKRHAEKIFDILNLFIAFLNLDIDISNVSIVNTIFKQYHFCVSNLFRLIVNRNIVLSNDRSEIKQTGANYHTHFIAQNLHFIYNADITKR